MRTVFAFAAMLLPAAALAEPQTSATYDFTKPFLSLDGKQVGENGNQLTLGRLAGSCLVNDMKIAPEQKAAAWALANRIVENPSATLSAHDISMIEDCLGRNGSPLAAGQIDHFLEPERFPDK